MGQRVIDASGNQWVSSRHPRAAQKTRHYQTPGATLQQAFQLTHKFNSLKSRSELRRLDESVALQTSIRSLAVLPSSEEVNGLYPPTWGMEFVSV